MKQLILTIINWSIYILFFTTITIPVLVNCSDKDVLANLFNNLGGESWNSKQLWLESDDICIWQGVSCVRGTKTVESIYLPNNQITGTLDILQLLLDLPSLKRLNLEGNNFHVEINNATQDVTSELEELVLNRLYLKNEFLGLFERATFTELKELSLVSCNLGGEMPFFSTVSLPKLEKLDLNENNFHSLPESKTTNLPELNFLSINTNSIEGTLPNYLTEFNKLQFLFLKENYFHGSLDIITSFPNLESVDVSAQLIHSNCSNGFGFTGTLPAFNTQPKLRRVNIRENCLTGGIPMNLLDGVDLSNFDFFMADTNMLSGIFPAAEALLDLPVDAMFFENNLLTGINDELCMGKEFGCDSILCPTGTYSKTGRRISAGTPCSACSQNKFIGMTLCGPAEKNNDDYFDDTYKEQSDNDNNSNVTADGNNPQQLSEYEILKLLYYNTGGPSWNLNENWLKDSNVCNSWFGVSCDDNNSVQSLMLR